MRPAILLLLGARDPDARAWAASVAEAGGQVSSIQTSRVSTLIRALKAGGVWSSLDRLWLFAAENAPQALIDLKARATATAVNSPAFTANRGYAGNGSTSYINTGFNPTGGSPNYVRDSATYGCWIETADSAPASLKRLIGNDSANFSEMSTTNGGNYLYSINQGSAGNTGVSTTATGCFSFSRVAASGAGAINSYKDGASTNSNTIASIAIPNNSFFVLASNNAGAPFQPSDARIAADWMGGGLNAAQQLALYNALRTYMTAVGVA